jgi:hypothetical protein
LLNFEAGDFLLPSVVGMNPAEGVNSAEGVNTDDLENATEILNLVQRGSFWLAANHFEGVNGSDWVIVIPGDRFLGVFGFSTSVVGRGTVWLSVLRAVGFGENVNPTQLHSFARFTR